MDAAHNGAFRQIDTEREIPDVRNTLQVNRFNEWRSCRASRIAPLLFGIQRGDIVAAACRYFCFPAWDDDRRAALPIKALGDGKAFREVFVELSDDFGGGCLTANGINDDDRVTLTRDFGRVSLSEHGRHASWQRLGIKETRVEVATDDFKLEVVEEVWCKPDERIVLECLAQPNSKNAGGVVKKLSGVVFCEKQVCRRNGSRIGMQLSGIGTKEFNTHGFIFALPPLPKKGIRQ